MNDEAKASEPNVDEPKAEEPKAEEPKAEEPKSEGGTDAASAKDRRKGGRIACRWLKSNFGTVVNLSTTGVLIRTRGQELKVGETVVLRLNTNVGSLLVCSRVAQILKARGGEQDVGFEFCEKDKDLRAALSQAARMHAKGETVGAEAADRLCAT